MEDVGLLKDKFLYRDHFLPTDFTTLEGIHLNRVAVPCVLDSASHSNPQPLLSLPSLFDPMYSQVSPQKNNQVMLPQPLPSELTPEKYNLHVLPPLKTYSKLAVPQPLLLRHLFLPHRRSVHFLQNLCTKTCTNSSQHSKTLLRRFEKFQENQTPSVGNFLKG
jgi:hypothetical protein